MRYYFLLLSLGALFANCGKEIIPDPEEQLALDIDLIEGYVRTNNLDAIRTPSGLHYVITEQGTGQSITPGGAFNVLYRGYFTNGTVFEATRECSPVTLALNDLILGWQEGIPLFQTGGKGTLLIPSGLAFGPTGNRVVPGNSVVIFDIEIVNQNKFDEEKITTFLSDNNLSAEKTASGLYYIIEEEGTGRFPDENSTVTVNYVGYFADGTEFDRSQDEIPATFELSNVIQGWQEGIPLFKKGGKGKLLIPSRLAYGESGNNSIPGNTAIFFDIELVDFGN